jgi:predicted  nucleic acid-binding Zn-ribbon protein
MKVFMDKPILLSDLVDLQEIDNAIYSYNQQKKEGTFVVNLKKLEIEYKTLLEEKNIKSEVLENYFISKKEFDRKLQEIEIKNNDIISKLSKKDLLPTELENYQKQLKVSETNFEEVLSKIDKLQYENKDNLEDYELLLEKIKTLKNDLLKNSTILQDEWKKLDSKISELDIKKNVFIKNLSIELQDLYKNLKSSGVEVVAAYKLDNQCGCCGVDLTSSELEQVEESRFKQCPYCNGVIV